MASGMMSTYCGKKDGKGGSPKCYKFTDGSEVCMCKRAWSVFFATLNQHGWKDTEPRHSSVSETVLMKAIEETVASFVDYYETRGS